MTDKAWKAYERWVCKQFGGKRSGPTGSNTPDCKGTRYAIECKYGAAAPINQTLQAAMDQAVTNAGDRLPVLVLKPRRWNKDDSWVCIKMRYFREILDDISVSRRLD